MTMPYLETIPEPSRNDTNTDDVLPHNFLPEQASAKNILRVMKALSRSHQILDYEIYGSLPLSQRKTLIELLLNAKEQFVFTCETNRLISFQQLLRLKRAGLYGLIFNPPPSLLNQSEERSAIKVVEMLRNARALSIEMRLVLPNAFSLRSSRELGAVVSMIKTCWHLFYEFGESDKTLVARKHGVAIGRGYGIQEFRDRRTDISFQYHNNYWRNLRKIKWNGCSRPRLTYRRGQDYLLLEDERMQGILIEHQLLDVERDIYLYCETPKKRAQIYKKFSRRLSANTINKMLKDLCKLDLLFSQRDAYLCLAIPEIRHLNPE